MTTLRIGIYPAVPGIIEDCATHLKELRESHECHTIGVSADVLGKALAIANVSYRLVQVEGDVNNVGHYDKQTDRWTGTVRKKM